MLLALKQKNNSIRDLKNKLKQASGKTSIRDLDDILTSVADRKAFILLFDMYDTEKEITRDLLEMLIEHSYEIHKDLFEYLENSNTVASIFSEIFSMKNIKSLAIFSIAVGVVIALATHPTIASNIITTVVPSSEKSK